MSEGRSAPPPSREYVDELNLARLPIGVLGKAARGSKTLEFSVRINGGERRWTVLGTEKWGLPNGYDDDVLLVLVKLTQEQGFQSSTVSFTRGQVLRELGWDANGGQSYRRLHQSLRRLGSVTYDSEFAWFSKPDARYLNAQFGLIDEFTLTANHATEDAAGSFVRWSRVFFENLRHSNLKQLDWESLRRISAPVGKRLYRLLDFELYRERSRAFDLRALCHEHLALSRNKGPKRLMQDLEPVLGELEEIGFLQSWRFEQRGNAWWLQVERTGRERELSRGDWVLVDALTKRGVTRTTAKRLVKAHPERHVRRRVEEFDWLLKQGTLRNPPGHLYSSITREDWKTPEGFRPRSVRKRAAPSERPAEEAATEKEASTRAAAFDRYWSSLNDVEQALKQESVIARLDRFTARKLDEYRLDPGKAKLHGELLRDVLRKHLEGEYLAEGSVAAETAAHASAASRE